MSVAVVAVSALAALVETDGATGSVVNDTTAPTDVPSALFASAQ